MLLLRRMLVFDADFKSSSLKDVDMSRIVHQSSLSSVMVCWWQYSLNLSITENLLQEVSRVFFLGIYHGRLYFTLRIYIMESRLLAITFASKIEISKNLVNETQYITLSCEYLSRWCALQLSCWDSCMKITKCVFSLAQEGPPLK